LSLSDSPLVRLRLGFFALAAALLLTVGGLLQSAVSRLDSQRRLRHLMVAERVFDEAEREVSSLLQHEVERPSSAYDTQDTDPSRWSPFVVGYYRRDPALHVIAESKLQPARRTRLRQAVERMRAQLDAARVAPPPADAGDSRGHEPEPIAQASSPDVLRQLNRSVKVRERRQYDLTDSFVVLAAAPDTLIIERRSHDGTRREGFVLDVPRLVSTIQHWVLGAQGLDTVASLYAPSSRPPEVASAYEFSHELAPPLDSQVVSLRLSQLDDEDASSTLYGLAALLAAAATLGILALYRMVAVQVRFAERRNNFVSAVTHELKTPLTSIRMYGEMLRDGMVQDETVKREYYATITAEGERLTRLINNVLEHAKLRSGGRRAQVVKGDVGAVVKEVVDLMRPHIEHEGFAIELEIAAGLPPVQLDVDAFKQVLFNVLDNALKYGRDAERRALQIACVSAQGRVVVSVRDFGPGVRDDQLKAVFEPFFRGQDELTRRQKGTGIGLSLVRDLVELMNGQVHGRNRAPGFEICIALTPAG
jgi:signal transduction histidine kinase